ncbi:MAG: MFS transporter [Chloroflexi bacterium]|nr:MFS transporter [Chloroflexota bacterium]
MLRTLTGVSVGWLGISMVADGLPTLLMPYQLARGGSTDATTLGVITLAAIAVAAAIQPLAGHWSDRTGRVPVLAAGTVTALLGLGLMLQPGAALPATVLALVGVSVAQAGQQPLLPDLVPARLRGRGGGLKGAFDVGGAFIGFVVLAAALGSGNPGAAVAALASAIVASFALTAALVGRGARRRAPTPRRSLLDAYRLDLGSHRELATVIAARFLFLLGIYAVGRFLLLFVADRLGLSPERAGEQAGLALALLAAITVIASVPSGWLADRFGRRPLMAAGGALAAAGIGLLPLASSIEPVLLFGGLMALGTGAFASASWALLADLTSDGESGRLLGIAHLGTAAAAAAAGAFGLVIDAGGYGVAFLLAALVTLMGGLLLGWRAARRGEREYLIGSAEGVH